MQAPCPKRGLEENEGPYLGKKYGKESLGATIQSRGQIKLSYRR